MRQRWLPMDRWDRVALTVSLSYVAYLLGLATGALGDDITGWRFWAATAVEVVNCTTWLVHTDRQVTAQTERLRVWGEQTRAARDS